MLRIAAVLLMACVVAASPGLAGPARNVVTDCYNQQALIPITRSQAQSYLPEGFATGVGAAGNSEVPYLYVASIMCGHDSAPELELASVFLAVRPPREVDSPDSADRYLLDVVASGTRVRSLEKRLCLELESGEIDSFQDMETGDGSVSRGSSEIVSDQLDLTFEVTTTGSEGADSGAIRWHFDSGGGFEYFDELHQQSYLSFGAGRVEFRQPYRDLPPAVPAVGFYEYLGGILFTPSPACSGGR